MKARGAVMVGCGAGALILGGALLLAHRNQRSVEAPRPDIVLITVDTLRADALGFAGNRRAETPVLDRLAATGRVFPDAHAHNVATLPSHANILTGLYPYQHGVRDNSGFRLAATFPTLATLLHAAGYATGAFVSGFPLDSQFGLGRGFEVYDDRTTRGPEGEQFRLAERRGDEVVAAALAWWRGQKGRPRFLWVHLFDPHAPYDPPEPFASRFPGDPYHGEVAAADAFLAPLLGPFLDRREKAPFVVMTADHGESLGEHGELTHGLFAYEATLRVPLVLWGPGVRAGRDPRPARHVDIFPTVLAVASLAAPAPGDRGRGRERAGRSLLAPAAPQPEGSYFEALSATFNRRWAPLKGVIRGGRKFILLPLPEVYDLARDPGERENLYARERAAAREAFAALPREPDRPAGRTEVAPETAARLLSLGYVTGDAGETGDLGGNGVSLAVGRYGPQDDPKTLVGIDRELHEVVDRFSRGQLDFAVQRIRAVVAARPTMPFAQSLLALCLLESGRTEEALAAMEEARRRGVTSEALLRQLGLTLAKVGRTDEALATLRPLAAEESPQAWNALALVLSQAGRQDEAAAMARRVLAVDPGNARAHEQLGMIELRRGHWAAAREQLERAVAANPRLPVAWNNLGVALYQLGQTRPALAAWQRAVDLDPNLWDTLWNLGTMEAQQGLAGPAEATLGRFIAHAPPQYGEQIAEARQVVARLLSPRLLAR